MGTITYVKLDFRSNMQIFTCKKHNLHFIKTLTCGIKQIEPVVSSLSAILKNITLKVAGVTFLEKSHKSMDEFQLLSINSLQWEI